MASEGRSPARTTSLASIIVFQVEGESADSHEFGRQILELIASRYGSKPPQPEHHTLTVGLDGFQLHAKLVEEETRNVFIVTVSRSSGEPSKGWREDLSRYQDQIRPLLQSLPSNSTAIFSVFTAFARSRDEALTILRQYSTHLAQRPIGVGVVQRCLLAMFDGGPQGDDAQVVERDLLLAPLNSRFAEAEATISEFLEDISFLASIEGETHRLHRMRQPFFVQIGPAEEDTQKAIEETLAKRYGRASPLEDMEASLVEITGRFSTLSVLAGAVRRDYITVEDRLDKVEGLLRRWNESEVEGYPTIFSMEMMHCKALSKPFKDFVDRTEALRGELGTVLDTVRTRLSVEQQRLTVEEQKSSKDLLARLVNLQEVLHKLEILVVAFYITEMGRLVFEAVAYEAAALLTVAFIPLALLMAVGIGRLLHGHRGE